MAEAKQSGGFVTAAQQGGKGGGASAPQLAGASNDQVINEINEAIKQYDGYIKKYLKDTYMNETFVSDAVNQYIIDYMGGGGFTDRKITDTPTDSLMITNRKFVTLNGTTADRPASPVTGQYYYDSTLNKPIWWNGSGWRTPASVLGA